MTSILRSPVISPETRKLPARGALSEAPVQLDAPPAAPVAPAAAPQPAKAPLPNHEALLAQAREAVLAQFKQEAETARELGRQRGLQEGRAAGAEEARLSAETELARIRSISGKLQATLASGIEGVEEMAVAIAFAAACRMLGTAAVSRNGIRALVQEAAAHAAGAGKVVVRLHPGDLAALQEAGGLDTVLPQGAGVQWTGDTSIELGGCVVETDGGTLDARLETQIERLRAALVAARSASAQ